MQINTQNTWFGLIAMILIFINLAIAGILYSKEIKKQKIILFYGIRFSILFMGVVLITILLKIFLGGISIG